MVQWLRQLSNTGGAGLIPGQGVMPACLMAKKMKHKQQKRLCNKLCSIFGIVIWTHFTHLPRDCCNPVHHGAVVIDG